MKFKIKFSFNKIIEIYRIRDWYYFLGFIFLGFSFTEFFNVSLLKYFILGSLSLSFAYSFNDFCDKVQDKKYFLIPMIFSILILPLYGSLQIFLSCLFLFIVTIYSAKPLRLKSVPFISTFLNHFGFGILFLVAYSHNSFIDFSGIILFFLFFSLGTVSQLIHEVVDMKEDKRQKIHSTAIFCGIKNIKMLCKSFLLISMIITTYLFYIKKINLLFLFTTILFTSYFFYEISVKKIDIFMRKKYRNFGFIAGLFYYLSMILSFF